MSDWHVGVVHQEGGLSGDSLGNRDDTMAVDSMAVSGGEDSSAAVNKGGVGLSIGLALLDRVRVSSGEDSIGVSSGEDSVGVCSGEDTVGISSGEDRLDQRRDGRDGRVGDSRRRDSLGNRDDTMAVDGGNHSVGVSSGEHSMAVSGGEDSSAAVDKGGVGLSLGLSLVDNMFNWA